MLQKKDKGQYLQLIRELEMANSLDYRRYMRMDCEQFQVGIFTVQFILFILNMSLGQHFYILYIYILVDIDIKPTFIIKLTCLDLKYLKNEQYLKPCL